MRGGWVTCEMHSGFTAMRTVCAMGPAHTMVGPDGSDPPRDAAVEAEVIRLVEIFRTMRARFGAEGDYLFGAWSVPDAFFTPIAARLRHYRFDLAKFGDDDGVGQTYCEALLNQPDFLEWSKEGLADAARINPAR